MAFDVFAAKSQALTGQLIIGFAVALHKEFVAFFALNNIFVVYFINRHKRLTAKRYNVSRRLSMEVLRFRANTYSRFKHLDPALSSDAQHGLAIRFSF